MYMEHKNSQLQEKTKMEKMDSISIKEIEESLCSWNRKNDSPRGCETVSCTQIKVGDKVVVNNYFTLVTE